MKKTGLLIVFALVLSACGQAPTPMATPNIQQTIEVVSSTMIAETLTAQPTPSTVPSNTPEPSATPTILPTETPTPDPASITLVSPTTDPVNGPTETPWSGTLSPGNTDGLPKGFLRIENNTGVKEITISMTGITLTREQPIYLAYKVTGALNLVILWAHYDYVIQVPGKIIFKGKFTQNNKDKTTIRVLPNKVVIVGP